MMRRVMCVWCPLWPIQRLRSLQHDLRDRPLILFAESQRRLHVTACSPEAVTFGVQVGMPVGEARSLLPTAPARRRQPIGKPIFQRADPAADRERLQALALHCQRYSPLVGLEESPTPESLWFDISGSEALFGGERGLAEAVRIDLNQQGIKICIAIAETWGTAWAVSHFVESEISLVPAAEQINVLARLSVAALRVPGNVIETLRSLDISTIEQLMRLPRGSLPSRFGKELLRRLDQALGLAPELMTAERLVEPLRAERLFEEPVMDRQTLDHVCRMLLEGLLMTLDDRRAGLRELTCYWLGTALKPFSLRLLRPTTDRRHLFELLQLQCERTVFMSGVTGVRMEIIEMGFPPIRQALLFNDDAIERLESSLVELVDRLSSRLGSQAVLRSSLQPDPLPELSYQSIPWVNAATVPADTKVNLSGMRCRPLQLLKVPQALSVEQHSSDGLPSRVARSPVVQISGPERIESGWWRGPDLKREYYRLDLANGAGLWTFCELNSGRWFLHGFFS